MSPHNLEESALEIPEHVATTLQMHSFLSNKVDNSITQPPPPLPQQRRQDGAATTNLSVTKLIIIYKVN